jgi:L-ectoine synthase
MEPGMMYCVGPADRHSMFAKTDLHLLSIFCPALQGDEMHDDEGTLAPSGPIPPGPTKTRGRKPSC